MTMKVETLFNIKHYLTHNLNPEKQGNAQNGSRKHLPDSLYESIRRKEGAADSIIRANIRNGNFFFS